METFSPPLIVEDAAAVPGPDPAVVTVAAFAVAALFVVAAALDAVVAAAAAEAAVASEEVAVALFLLLWRLLPLILVWDILLGSGRRGRILSSTYHHLLPFLIVDGFLGIFQ